MRVLVAGHVTLDRYGTQLVPGGAAYYAAHVYRALGAEVRIATAAGRDFPAGALAGLAAHVAPAARTVIFSNAYAPDGARSQRASAGAPALDPAALPAGWHEADLLHLAPVLGEIDLASWRAAVPARFVGLEIQGWVRALGEGGQVSPARWLPSPGELAGVAAAVAGDDDLRGQPGLRARLTETIPAVAFTHGEEGAEVAADGRITRVGVYRTFASDPTGAGDAFAAAFFLGLARGDGATAAAQLGAAAASIVVEGRAGGSLARVGEAVVRAPTVLTS
jgi:sugar/nucleoside kinase (ribokinase family)